MATAATPACIVVGPADDGRRVSAEDYFRIEAQPGYRCELTRGVLEVSHIPDEFHALLVCFFYDVRSAYRRAHPGRIFLYGGSNEFHFWLPEMISGRNPDVPVSLHDAPLDPEGHMIASLVFEIVSPGTPAHKRDHVTKREEYLTSGIGEYWIVDRFARTVTVLTREGDTWAENVFREVREASGRVLPGFVVPVADLWATVAAVPDNEVPSA